MLNSQKVQNNTSENRKLNEEQMIQFESKEENLHYPGVFDVDPKELSKKLSQVCLIDVRQPEEFTGELGHIPKAKILTLDTLEDRLSEIPKDQTVVFVCRSGGRSARATSLAQSHGFTNVYNLKGGMLLWNDLHLPTEM
jgi:hydroxyacylglutathione hydrolase